MLEHAREGLLHARELGSGPAVVMLHGLPSSSDAFLPLARALASRHRAILVDLPGYRQSARPADASIATAQRELERLLQALEIERAAFVGFSAGGYRALRLALERPTLVAAVACLGATPGPTPEEAPGHRALVQALRAGVDLRDVAVQRFLSPPWQTNADAVRAIHGYLAAAPADVVAAELEGWLVEPSLLPRLNQLRCPLLLRVGELDLATPVAHSQAIARLVPGATLQVVPGRAHALLVEDAAATTAAVQEFLAEHYR